MSNTPKIEACHHIGLCVNNFEESRLFYSNILQLTEIPRPAELQAIAPGMWFQLGPQELHLFEGVPNLNVSGLGYHFAVCTTDVTAYCDAVKQAGGELSMDPMKAPDGITRAMILDPSGNLIEINDGSLHSV